MVKFVSKLRAYIVSFYCLLLSSPCVIPGADNAMTAAGLTPFQLLATIKHEFFTISSDTGIAESDATSTADSTIVETSAIVLVAYCAHWNCLQTP